MGRNSLLKKLNTNFRSDLNNISPFALPGGNGPYVLWDTYKHAQDISLSIMSAVLALVLTIAMRSLPQSTKYDDVVYATGSTIATVYISLNIP